MSDDRLRQAANEEATVAAEHYVMSCWWDALHGHGANYRHHGKRWFVQLRDDQEYLVVMHTHQTKALRALLPEDVAITDDQVLDFVSEVLTNEIADLPYNLTSQIHGKAGLVIVLT